MKKDLFVMDQSSLLEKHPYDIAQAISDLPLDEQSLLINTIENTQLKEVLTHLDKEDLNQVVTLIEYEQLNTLLSQLELNDFYEVMDSLNEINLEKVNKQNKTLFDTFNKYPEDSAGYLLSKHFFILNPQMTIKEAIRILRNSKIDQLDDRLFISEDKKLVGEVNTKDLILYPSDTQLETLMKEPITSINVNVDQEEVAHIFSNYDAWVLPVVNDFNEFIGIINVDDVLDIIQEEAQEDQQKMSAVSPLEDSYFESSTLVHVKKRIGWLLFLMFSASITGIIINQYEHAFETIPLLVSFIPMIMDTGGNSGSQSSTLIIQGLATGEVKTSDWLKVLLKELRISTITSIILAIANGIRIYYTYYDLKIAFVVCATLIFTVILAKLLGSTLPLLAKKLNMDPAVMASPLITTIVDTCSIILYFTIATHYFNL